MIIPKFEILYPKDSRLKISTLKQDYSDFYQYIKDKYSDYSLSEGLYRFYNNITETPKCPTCGKDTKYGSITIGYSKYCSSKCANSNPDKKEKIKQTNLERYNGTGFASKVLKDKCTQTLIDHYGVDSPLRSSDIRSRVKETNKIRYGCEYGLQNEEVQQKISKSQIDRYGGRGFASSDIQEKAAQRCLERYGDRNFRNDEKRKATCIEHLGVEFPFQSKEIRDKVWNHNLEKFGHRHALQNPDLLNKCIESKHNTFMSQHDDIISIRRECDETIYTCKCPHPECSKCQEKTFDIISSKYRQRKIDKNEICTKLCPGNIFKDTSIEIFIQSILEEYQVKYIANERKLLNGLELDIYIPSHHLAIECNGCYWHSVYRKESKYHYNKYLQCKEKNIQLLTFWEDQIINYPEKVKSILLSKLGIYKERIYARQCSVHTVDSEHCRDFLDCYHLQHSVNSSVRLGLYYNDELISVMTFGKGRKCLNSNDDWELYRYCCKSEVQVIGGASKLFKYFINNYHPNQVVSFSSNDISDGTLYKQLGFEFTKDNLSYWYISREFIRYHRYNFTKQKLVKEGYDPNKTEMQIMTERGYYCIFDSGQTKWTWSKE